MSIKADLLVDLGILTVGRLPAWTNTTLAAPNGPPTGADGVALNGAPSVLVGVVDDGATNPEWRVWVRSADGHWAPANQAVFSGYTYERLTLGGFDRAYIEVTAMTGTDVITKIGPATAEV